MGAAHMRARKSRRQAARGERATARFADSADPGLPPAQGLYDPALEKDSVRSRLHRRHQGSLLA